MANLRELLSEDEYMAINKMAIVQMKCDLRQINVYQLKRMALVLLPENVPNGNLSVMALEILIERARNKKLDIF